MEKAKSRVNPDSLLDGDLTAEPTLFRNRIRVLKPLNLLISQIFVWSGPAHPASASMNDESSSAVA